MDAEISLCLRAVFKEQICRVLGAQVGGRRGGRDAHQDDVGVALLISGVIPLAVGDRRDLRGGGDLLCLLQDGVELARGKIDALQIPLAVHCDGDGDYFDAELPGKTAGQVARGIGHQFNTLHKSVPPFSLSLFGFLFFDCRKRQQIGEILSPYTTPINNSLPNCKDSFNLFLKFYSLFIRVRPLLGKAPFSFWAF